MQFFALPSNTTYFSTVSKYMSTESKITLYVCTYQQAVRNAKRKLSRYAHIVDNMKKVMEFNGLWHKIQYFFNLTELFI